LAVDEMKALGRIRRLAMMSQHELSRRANVRFSRLHYAESGRLRLTHDERERIETAIRAVLVKRMAEISELLGGRS
jgi:ribosome-binding protein aMBF1 (putative translation factor)